MVLVNEKEKTRINFQKSQAEKNYFLGEFKENVILAVLKNELDGKSLNELEEAMKREDAVLLKIRRDIPLKNIKRYIEEAEKIGLRYRLVDSLSFLGDVALVVVSDKTLDAKRDVIAKKRSQMYEDVGLSPSFSENEGKKICAKHYEMLKEKLPNSVKRFKKLNLMDVLLGMKCPICKDEREGNK